MGKVNFESVVSDAAFLLEPGIPFRISKLTYPSELSVRRLYWSIILSGMHARASLIYSYWSMVVP